MFDVVNPTLPRESVDDWQKIMALVLVRNGDAVID
jgi:hypothetical protein